MCGGAFAGLEKIIDGRIGKKSIGFRAEIGPRTGDTKLDHLMTKVLPEDLLKFGLIPEFVGRLPVIGAVQPLDKAALIEILVQPLSLIHI